MFLAARLRDARTRDLLEADLAEVYGLDLERMGLDYSVGHAAVLAANLPASSRTMRDIDGRLEWGSSEYLLALVVDNLAALRYEESRRAGSKRAEKPEPVERPGRRAERRRKVGLPKEQLDRLLFSPRSKSGEVV